MNDKEKELWRVIDNVIKCCAIELPDGELSITREDVLGKSRAENLVMTRCMVVEQMIHAGFSITTIATVLNRTVPAVRHLCKMAYTYSARLEFIDLPRHKRPFLTRTLSRFVFNQKIKRK